MVFRIDEIAYEYDQIIVVTGKTQVGEIKGVWKYREKPVKNQRYFVELAYDIFEKKISKSLDKILSVSMNEYVNIFYGEIDGMDEEVFYIRFADDWLDMMDIREDESSELISGDYVTYSVKYQNTEIYPYT